MPIYRPQLKERARENIHAAVPRAVLVTLVFYLLTDVVQTVLSAFVPSVETSLTTEELYAMLEEFNAAPEVLMRQLSGSIHTSMVGVFAAILVMLFGMVVRFGYCRYTLEVARGEASGYSALLFGFPWTGKVLAMNLLILLYVFLWGMAGSVVLSLLVVFLGPLALVGAIAVVVWVLLMALRYAQADYLLAQDPEQSVFAVIRASKALMRGRTGEYFVLLLSFLGWSILGGIIMSLLESLLLRLGLGDTAAALLSTLVVLPYSIWLTTYRNFTYAHYYLAITAAPGEGAAPDGWIGPDRPY